MATIKADRFTALKAKVKAECLRRCYSGSVADYGGAAYDYTVAPATGRTVLQEHRDKLSGPLRAINSNGLTGTSGPGPVKEMDLAAMETKVIAWAARSITDSSGSDCQSGCTGTCYTGCTTGCSGCDGCSGCGGCGGGCSGCDGCGSGCPTGCSGCGSGCPSGCSNCGGACSSCSDGCTANAGQGTSGCTGACSGACTRASR